MRGVYEVLSVIKEWIDKRDFYSIENFYRELTKEFISKTTPPHPCPLPPGERGLISPPLTGGDEGEGDTCGFTDDAPFIRSGRENLHYVFGKTYSGRFLFVVVRFVKLGEVRVITARHMNT